MVSTHCGHLCWVSFWWSWGQGTPACCRTTTDGWMIATVLVCCSRSGN